MIDRVAPVFKVTTQQIGKNDAAQFPQMDAGMCGGAAGINVNLSRGSRFKHLFFARQAVE